MLRGNRCSSADAVTRLQDEQSQLRFPGRIKKFLFFKTLEQSLLSISSGQPHIFPAANNCSVDFPTQLCPTAVGNAWSYTSPPHVFMTRTRGVLPFVFVWILVEHGGM